MTCDRLQHNNYTTWLVYRRIVVGLSIAVDWMSAVASIFLLHTCKSINFAVTIASFSDNIRYTIAMQEPNSKTRCIHRLHRKINYSSFVKSASFVAPLDVPNRFIWLQTLKTTISIKTIPWKSSISSMFSSRCLTPTMKATQLPEGSCVEWWSCFFLTSWKSSVFH